MCKEYITAGPQLMSPGDFLFFLDAGVEASTVTFLGIVKDGQQRFPLREKTFIMGFDENSFYYGLKRGVGGCDNLERLTIVTFNYDLYNMPNIARTLGGGTWHSMIMSGLFHPHPKDEAQITEDDKREIYCDVRPGKNVDCRTVSIRDAAGLRAARLSSLKGILPFSFRSRTACFLRGMVFADFKCNSAIDLFGGDAALVHSYF